MGREEKSNFLVEIEKLHRRHELSSTVGPDYFEPGMMEYLDKTEGIYIQKSDTFLLRFEAKGTRHEGRTEQIEKVKVDDLLQIKRDKNNIYNSNNFRIFTKNNRDVGNMPANLCNVLAPLYDKNEVQFSSARVSYVEPLSTRSRHAKQAVLFVELQGKICIE
ncbi:hypothetical protein H6B33_06180 [Gemmiger formicilis]|uniref:HIRAN domain-containing protein n=1 Tax=Gemmiger formicilis TaxID=745368 RepID=UPI00195DE8B0|nr:HIRAN domain-containing protein [Gemmiger formicilis]MBM6914988.1 hypothetical protein [Gemmiger formicilis]